MNELMDTPCEHGHYLDTHVCYECERREEAETCPVCQVGHADRLSNDGYSCRECPCVYTLDENGDKTYFMDATEGVLERLSNGKYEEVW